MSENPYQQTPTVPVPPTRQSNPSERVKLPAILLLISGILSMISGVAGGGMTALVYLGMQDEVMEELRKEPPDPDGTLEQMEVALDFIGWGGVATGILGMISGMVVIAGAICMFKRRNWNIALIASILSMIPCLQPCCLFSFPVGIFVAFTLADSDVRSAFE